MGFLTESCPPGPCGICGSLDTVTVSVTKEWVQPNHGEGYYTDPAYSVECSGCNGYTDDVNVATIALVEVWGGRQGYAVGLDGPQFKAAMQAAGWKNRKPFTD